MKKNKKKVIIIISIIVLLLISIITLVILKNKKKTNDIDITNNASLYKINDNALDAFDLYFLQSNNKNKNVIYSPLSIKYALSMLSDASTDKTRIEIANILGSFEAKKYENNQNLSLANAMFIKDSYKKNIKDTYINLIKNNYNAQIIYDSFESPKNINNWVKNKTLGLIDNLLDDTIIVAFTDHPNKLVIRDDETEKLNKTIFYIYDHEMNSNQIDTITSSINILPTVINLFGIKNNYLYSGYDALDTNEEYVIFKDYTYFDGKEVKTVTKEYKDKLEYSSDILSSDYYKDNTVKK